MAVTLLNNFAGGTNGVAITPGNSGGASGSAFDFTEVFGTAALTYVNSPVHVSAIAGAASNPASQQSDFGWNTSLTATGLAQVWFRIYSDLSTVTSQETRAVQVRNTGGGACCTVVYENSQLQVTDASGGAILTSALTLPSASYFRVEGFCIGSATVGQVQVKTFLSPDSATPDETLTSSALQNTSGLVFGIAWGNRFNGGGTTVVHTVGAVGVTDQGYLGPIATGATVSGAVAPLALAAPAGTVTADATILGQTAQLVLSAPAGAAQSNAVTIAGPVAQLVLAAPAGGVSAPHAGTSQVTPDLGDAGGLLRKPVLW